MKVRFRQINLFLFVLYNIVYVFYMCKYINRNVYLLFLGTFFMVQVLELIRYRLDGIFREDFTTAIIIVLVLGGISVGMQVVNFQFEGYLIEELMYFIVPPLTAYCCINSGGKQLVDKYIYIIFLKMALYFILTNYSTLSLASIFQINAMDSESSLYENVIAHDFFILMAVFVYQKKYKSAILSFVLCVLCFKRLPFLLSFVLLVATFISWFGTTFKAKKTIKQFSGWLNKPFSRTVVLLIVIGCIFLPVLLRWFYSDEGVIWFADTFKMDLNSFSSGRFGIINGALENCQFNGLGSATHYFKTSSDAVLRRIGNMHCDVLRLLMEVTIVGYGSYIFGLMKIFKKNRFLTLLLGYVILEMALSHMADNLNVWTIMYLMASYFAVEEDDGNYDGINYNNCADI